MPDKPNERRLRLLIMVLAYNAESTVRSVLERIPAGLPAETEILVLDDRSADDTFEVAREIASAGRAPYPLTVLHHPVNQGYGGNQKVGYHYAIAHGFDLVAMIHGDAQHAPEELPRLLEPLLEGRADAVFGSRMMSGTAALRGGMPLYKFVGNRILTWLQNRLLGSRLSEFHSGYRVYSTAALQQVPFHLNTNGFHFDTEIIIQLLLAGCRIVEVPVTTHYGDEICRVDGLRYAAAVVMTTVTARLQGLGLIYNPSFNLPSRRGALYEAKLDFPSTHSWVVEHVPAGATVLDIGCSDGHVARALTAKGCRVIGIDRHPPADPTVFARFLQTDLDSGRLDPEEPVDVVLALDVIEHMLAPEAFAAQLHALARANSKLTLLISTGNIAFLPLRLMLLAGQFNYGPRGILDLTHTRLFTFASLRRLLRGAGFEVRAAHGIPAPFPLALGRTPLARWLLWVNGVLLRLSRGAFAYQMLMECRPVPRLEWLLADAVKESRERSRAGARQAAELEYSE